MNFDQYIHSCSFFPNKIENISITPQKFLQVFPFFFFSSFFFKFWWYTVAGGTLVSRSGVNLEPLALEGGVSTTGPPEKSLLLLELISLHI